jgi:hypothetical protein
MYIKEELINSEGWEKKDKSNHHYSGKTCLEKNVGG